MTPLELAAWLRTGTARAQPRAARGRRVLAVLALLARRPSQLTEADTGLMGEVVATVRAERAAGPGELPDALWRARLMCLGHDPLRS
ncbi:DUF3140 domain-containing protein [Streptomyces sp. 7-21]|nr:DUF3140 domain-containing protein [Streptomyces sp. 7-21]